MSKTMLAGEKSDIENVPIFLIGIPRSGSTLWSNIVANHPDVTLFTEMHYLNPWWKDIRYVIRQAGDLSDDENAIRLVQTIFSDPSAPGLERGFHFWKSIHEHNNKGLPEAIERRLLSSDNRNEGTLFKIIIEEATKIRGKRRAAVKFPVYPCYVENLQQWWPNSRVVHISRDPRSLAASKTNDPGGTAKLTTRYPWTRVILPYFGMAFATIQYIWASRVHRRMAGSENYRLYLYEDLLTEPEATIRSLCEFCGLRFSQSMLNPNAGQASSVTGLKASGFDPSRASGWKKVLKPWQAYLIGMLTKRSMARFGYLQD